MMLILNIPTAGPLPRFDGFTTGSNASSPHAPPGPLQPQASGGPIRVPPLAPEKVNEYTSIFENAGSQNGILPGRVPSSKCSAA